MSFSRIVTIVNDVQIWYDGEGEYFTIKKCYGIRQHPQGLFTWNEALSNALSWGK